MGTEALVKLLSESYSYNSFISWLASLGFLPKLTNVISDTYTLIVGFVAIGIPLAIQIAGQATEKYDNSLLAERLTQGLFVNPVRLIIISVLYIGLSIYLKLTTDAQPSDIPLSDAKLLITFLLCILFFITLVSAGWFYIRLYYRSLTKTDRYCKKFLKLENPMLMSLLIRFNVRFKHKWLSKIIQNYEGRRLSKSDLISVNAGLEVLIEQLKNRSWESEFTEILFLFHKKIRSKYFGEYNKSVAPLSKLDVKFIKLYWDALIRVVRISRNAEDVKLSHHSQRLLATVMSYIIYHPQYDLLVDDPYITIDKQKFNWATDLYEIARWQAHQPNKGIDLVIECEWFQEVFYITRDVDFKQSVKGIATASRLIIDILALICDEHPSKIIEIYRNISGNLYGEIHQNYYFTYPDDKTMSWILDFWEDFNKTEFSINNINTIEDMMLSLSDGRAYIKYGSYPTSQPLTEIEIKTARNAIKLDELHESIFLKFIKGIGWKFSAWLAFSKCWQELYDCLEWKQPKETIACHMGEAMLASSVSELLELMLRDYRSITSHLRFHERHEIGQYAFRAFLFQLCYFYERGNGIGLLYTSGTIDNSKVQKEILEKLLDQEKQVIGNVFSNKVVYSVGDEIRKSIVAIDLRAQNDEKNKPIAINKWLTLKNEIEFGWNEGFKLSNILNVGYKKKILHKELCLLKKHKINRKYLVECTEKDRSGHHYGKCVANNIISQLYNRFIDIANIGSTEYIVIDNNLVFASESKLKELGFKGIGINIWEHSHCPTSIAFTATSEQVLIIDCNKVSLNLSLNSSSFDGKSPLFMHYNDTHEAEVEIFVGVYCEILGGSGVILI